MRISVELNKEELEATFGFNNEWRNEFEITIGKEIFKCHV